MPIPTPICPRIGGKTSDGQPLGGGNRFVELRGEKWKGEVVNIGTRLIMTQSALKQRLNGRRNVSTGVFKGYCRDYTISRTIKVLRDGQKRHEVYHESYWQPKG